MVPSAKLTVDDIGVDRRNYRVSFRRIRERLGFVPKWTLQAGVQQVMDAILSGEVVDYRHPMYSNVKFLSDEPARPKPRKGWAEDLIQEVNTPFAEALAGRDAAALDFGRAGYGMSASLGD